MNPTPAPTTAQPTGQPLITPPAVITPNTPIPEPVLPPPPNEGGKLVGASHENGGIKFVVQPTGQRIEAEGGEYIVCQAAIESTQVFTFKGTRKQIAEKINELFGCNTGKVEGVQAGQYVLCNAATQNSEVIEVTGTVKEIINQISTSVKCNGIDLKSQVAPVMAMGGAVAAPYQPITFFWF